MNKQRISVESVLESNLEFRCSPAVITYPLASSIIIFDPKGDREPDPGDINAPPELDFILEPPLNIMHIDDPELNISDVA